MARYSPTPTGEVSAYLQALDRPPSLAHAAYITAAGLPVPLTQRQASVLVNHIAARLVRQGGRNV